MLLKMNSCVGKTPSCISDHLEQPATALWSIGLQSHQLASCLRFSCLRALSLRCRPSRFPASPLISPFTLCLLFSVQPHLRRCLCLCHFHPYFSGECRSKGNDAEVVCVCVCENWVSVLVCSSSIKWFSLERHGARHSPGCHVLLLTADWSFLSDVCRERCRFIMAASASQGRWRSWLAVYYCLSTHPHILPDQMSPQILLDPHPALITTASLVANNP